MIFHMFIVRLCFHSISNHFNCKIVLQQQQQKRVCLKKGLHIPDFGVQYPFSPEERERESEKLKFLD